MAEINSFVTLKLPLLPGPIKTFLKIVEGPVQFTKFLVFRVICYALVTFRSYKRANQLSKKRYRVIYFILIISTKKLDN